jgi:hypothetical protein
MMRILIAVMVLVTGAVAAAAQNQTPRIKDETLQQAIVIALENIQSARCEKGERCKPATEAEKAKPPISLDEANIIFRRAVVSAGGAYCNHDWQKRNFEPMMAYWRTNKKNERQLALISVMHGFVQQQMLQGLSAKGDCPAALKADVDKNLDFKPQ